MKPEITVGTKRENRQHVSVNVYRAVVEGMKIILHARRVMVPRVVYGRGWIADHHGPVFKPDVLDDLHLYFIAFPFAVEIGPRDRDYPVIFHEQPLELVNG